MASESRLTRFLNVDLELVSRADAAELVAAFGPATLTLRDSSEDGRRTIWLELADGEPVDAEDAVRRFVALVRAFSPEARRVWTACERRCLNVGIQAGAAPHAAAFPFSSEAIAGVAEIGASLEVTVYGDA